MYNNKYENHVKNKIINQADKYCFFEISLFDFYVLNLYVNSYTIGFVGVRKSQTLIIFSFIIPSTFVNI